MTVEIPGVGEFDDSDSSEWIATLPVETVGGVVDFRIVRDGEEDDLTALATCISNFRMMPRSVLNAGSSLVYAYYEYVTEVLSEFDKEAWEIPDIDAPGNVWTYVTLGDNVIVERDEKSGDWFVIWENECAWEAEHGLQLVLRNGEEVTRASEYDGFIRE